MGFEPTQPEATDLQSAPTLQLRRSPIYVWQAPKDSNPDRMVLETSRLPLQQRPIYVAEPPRLERGQPCGWTP